MTVRLNISEQAAFYDKWWANRPYVNRLKMRRASWVLEMMVKTRLLYPSIIDLGCGTGWLANTLSAFGPTSGVELSPNAIREAKRRYPHVDFEDADILIWEHGKAETFDIVVSQEVLEHVPDQLKYLKVAYGLLKPGGYLILTTPNARTEYAIDDEVQAREPKQPIESWLFPRELRALLNSAGFDVLEHSSVCLNYGVKGSYRFVNSERLRSLLSKANLTNLFDRWRERHFYGWNQVALARKR
jgi:2-polyprenyl-3-methyl-5-hydroxy-6-metoxy-1,4-benzoquinol methylase